MKGRETQMTNAETPPMYGHVSPKGF